MKRRFTASVVQEGPWHVVQCLEVDVASQGESPDDALANLRDALELHVEPPTATTIRGHLAALGTAADGSTDA